MQGTISIAKISGVATLLLAIAACGQDIAAPDTSAQDDGAAHASIEDPARAVDPSRVDAAPGSDALLMREGGEPGYLVDSAGSALYYVDGSGAPCDEACEGVWPPVLSDQPNPVAGPGVHQPAVGSEVVGRGSNHVTYHGHRLYRYAGDRGTHTATGHDVQDQWGHWRLMGADGQPGTAAPRDDARP